MKAKKKLKPLVVGAAFAVAASLGLLHPVSAE